MRILVAEDDSSILEFLVVRLEAECFAVDRAKDGERGSFLARTNDYDLIITDNVMPKRRGLEMVQDIRSAAKAVPILVLSVLSDPLEKVKLLEAGADDYLPKPFSFEELRARMNALLRRPALVSESVFSVGNLTLDATRHLVVRGVGYIYLTRKEFALLEYLMRHKGTVVSRGDLFEHVWNNDSNPFSNTVEAHMLHLRRKIENPDGPQLIHTVPGRGYVIDDQRPSGSRRTKQA